MGRRLWPGVRQCHHRLLPVEVDVHAASQLLPRVHRVASVLKRLPLGTRQGTVRPGHLDCYLDEFTVPLNRRTSRSRGRLFYRLFEQVVQVEPCRSKEMVGGRPLTADSQPEGVMASSE